MQKIIIIFLLTLSLGVNGFFMMQDIQQKQQIIESQKQVETPKIYFTEKLFSQDFQLKDYSATKFSLEQEGKDIIKNAREFHSSPAILKGEKYDKYLCAGFLYELSQKFWDPSAPLIIGMMEQNTKTPADAWQLPYSYEYVGGKILSDFTGDFSLETKDYWDKIYFIKLQNFFKQAFSELALLGDIGFFYTDTEYLQDLKSFGNANSHIVKNLGMSEFSFPIDFDTSKKSSLEIFSESLSCDPEIFTHMKDLLTNYEISLDGSKIVLYQDNFYYLREDSSLGEIVTFKNLSQIQMRDITMIHFFEGARVDSLFQLSCQGDFFPINIISINPRMIEKI